eukprot:4636217-Ditylum_brightwellii.AAC.1
MDIQVDWVMSDRCEQLNICMALVNLDNHLQSVDNRIYMKSGVNSNIWWATNNISTGEEFSTSLDIKQEQFNTIKHDNMVYSYLKHHKAYFRPDHFKHNAT